MLRSIPFLLFDGNCAQAMTFYHACFGGTLTLTKLKDTPMKDQFPIEKHERIINANLISDAVEITATDWMAAPTYLPRQGNTFAIFIVSDNFDALKTVFDNLSVGADKDRFQELHEMPFGMYGQFYDKYGVQWIFKADKKD